MRKLATIPTLLLCLVLCIFAFASCGKTETAASTTGTGPAATTAAATEHVHVPGAEFTIDIMPTCSYAGSKSYHCTECNQRIPGTDVEIPMLEHTPSATYTIETPPTCSTEGSKYQVCAVCSSRIEGSDVPIPADESAHVVENWIVTKEATLLENGSRHGFCTACSKDVQQDSYAYEPFIYNPADLEHYTYSGSTSMLLLSKTLPNMLNGDHFYPTAQHSDGLDAYFEIAVLWNETMANYADESFWFCLNYQGGAGSNLFYFYPKAVASNEWCKYAGGFDWGRGKSDAPVIFGPPGTKNGPKEYYPNIGEYGWHKIGFRVHQAAALNGDTVVYSGTSYLYVDGELVWKVDLDMDRIKSDKNLLFTATNNGGVLEYADNPKADKVRRQLRG